MLQVTRLAMWGVLVPTIVLCASARDVDAQPYNYTIMGDIRTSTGSTGGCDRPVGWVCVKVMEQNSWMPDGELGGTWTLPDGSFSCTFTSGSTTLLINMQKDFTLQARFGHHGKVVQETAASGE